MNVGIIFQVSTISLHYDQSKCSRQDRWTDFIISWFSLCHECVVPIIHNPTFSPAIFYTVIITGICLRANAVETVAHFRFQTLWNPIWCSLTFQNLWTSALQSPSLGTNEFGRDFVLIFFLSILCPELISVVNVLGTVQQLRLLIGTFHWCWTS